jgi:hypothetical protein
MVKLIGVTALAVAAVLESGQARASAGPDDAPPPRSCLQLVSMPEQPRRPSGREVRIVTYMVVRSLGVSETVGHPALFAYAHERAAGACDASAQSRRTPGPVRSRGDARGP